MYCGDGPRHFFLGEKKYVDFVVKSTRGGLSPSAATWKLTASDGSETTGVCVIDGDMVSALVEPSAVGSYTLDVTYTIGAETRIARAKIEVE